MGTVSGGRPNVPIAFENLFGGNFGTVVEKGRIIQNRLKIFGNL